MNCGIYLHVIDLNLASKFDWWRAFALHQKDSTDILDDHLHDGSTTKESVNQILMSFLLVGGSHVLNLT